MSGMKTLMSFVALVVTSTSLPAQPTTAPDPAHLFATCTGRLSAWMEHQWMFDGPGSEHTAHQRDQMIGLLGAVTPPGKGREILHLRIDAKMALASLLTRATFSDDTREARRAKKTVQIRLSECTGLLLS